MSSAGQRPPGGGVRVDLKLERCGGCGRRPRLSRPSSTHHPTLLGALPESYMAVEQGVGLGCWAHDAEEPPMTMDAAPAEATAATPPPPLQRAKL